MTDETTGGTGPANTPPFPRSYDPHAPLPPPHSAQPGGDPTAQRADRPPREEREARTPKGKGRPAGSKREGISRLGEQIGRRAERTLHHGIGHLADQLEDMAARVDHLADERLHALGPRVEKAAGAAESAAGWLHGAADYLRSSEMSDLRQDLERQVREKPLQSLVLAAGSGWLLGKIIR